MKIFILSTFSIILAALLASSVDADQAYQDERNKIIQEENKLRLGYDMKLEGDEKKADEIFLKHKQEELNGESNLPSMHYYRAKTSLQKSKVYQLIKKMPKGASLNIHPPGAVSSEWLVKNIASETNLRKCKDKELLTFREKSDVCKSGSMVVSNSEDKNKWFNMYTPQPELTFNSSGAAFGQLCDMFDRVDDALNYLPIFKAHYKQFLEELYKDNVMYTEVRVKFSELYDGTNKKYSFDDVVKEIENVVKEFKAKHPDFIGLKIIYAILRNEKAEEIRKNFEIYKDLRSKFPNTIIGLDFVGWEDKGAPLKNFTNEFLSAKQDGSKFFLHAGETNQLGSTDLNLVDALVLETTRIGHGYALAKHPVLMKMAKDKKIPVELCPVSNQINGFVADLRNHPGSILMSENVPIVLGNDSPGFMAMDGLSPDYYYTIMSLAPYQEGLKTLKKLVWNTIEYAQLNEEEKKKAQDLLKEKWNVFIKEVLKQEQFGWTDANLVDALLLNTTRIGHGYALVKHPFLMKKVKEKNIAVELCPVPNQIKGFIRDLRNHPGSVLMLENAPIVSGNDSPGFMNIDGLSPNYYYAIMSLAPYQHGLKTLKRLVWNTIKYAQLTGEEKKNAEILLKKKWNVFIKEILKDG
uniref:Adenosine deaminase n=1 Tax=Glossina brevipalpis TaxID=37001 RepID=A0A1A9WDL1_9MUSC